MANLSISDNVRVSGNTNDSGWTYLCIRDDKFKRSVDIWTDKEGVITEIGIHGHDEKRLDISKSTIQTKRYKGHKWRQLRIDDLDITLHHSSSFL